MMEERESQSRKRTEKADRYKGGLNLGPHSHLTTNMSESVDEQSGDVILNRTPPFIFIPFLTPSIGRPSFPKVNLGPVHQIVLLLSCLILRLLNYSAASHPSQAIFIHSPPHLSFFPPFLLPSSLVRHKSPY
jgi:hypothetical protein